MTLVSTAALVAGQTGYARLLQVPKFGQGNTSGIDLSGPISNTFRVRFHGAYSDYGSVVELMITNWTTSGVPAIQVTANTTVPRDLRIVVEETSTNYILLAQHNHAAARVQVDVTSQSASGFLDTFPNDPYTYAPTGKLIRPMTHNVSRSVSSGATAAQYARLATITFNTATTSRSLLLGFWDIESLTSGDSMGFLSIQARQGALNSSPTVSAQIIGGDHKKRFRFYTRTSFTSTTGTVDIYVFLVNTFSTFAYGALFEDGNGGANNPAVDFPYNLFLSTTTPTGTLVRAAIRGPILVSAAQSLATAGAVTVDASQGDVQRVTLAANASSIAIVNPITDQELELQVIQDTTGGRTYVLPANMKFPGGTAPAASTGANHRDIFKMRYDGTYWICTTAPSLGVR